MHISFKKWLTERTLYHGTVIDNMNSIRKLGLFGSDPEDSNSFISNAYAGGFDNEKDYNDYVRDKEIPVFMADKADLNKSVNAIHHHIAKKLNKGFHDVTPNDIRNHGLLVIVKDPDNNIAKVSQSELDGNTNYFGLEPDDYYSDGENASGFLYGNKLIKFLNKNNYKIIPDERYEKKVAGWERAKEMGKAPLFKGIM